MLHRVALLTDFSKDKKITAFRKLSLSEQEYIKKKPYDKAEQSICARILLSELIREETGKDVLDLIERDDNKRPFIRGMGNLFISISHSENLVAAAISKFPIGIDIEKIKPLKSGILERVLTSAEQEFVKAEDIGTFYKIWTAKEALIKTGAYSYAKAKNLSFVRQNKIICPEGFILEQYLSSDALISIIEQKK